MGRVTKRDESKKLIALLTNHCDDVYCFRKELLQNLEENGYQLLISCPDGDKFSLIDAELEYIYDDPIIDRRGTSIISDFKLMIHYYRLIKKYKPDTLLCYTIKPNVYASIAATITRTPYINNVTGLGSVINKGTIMQKFILTLFKIAFRHSDCIMFQNEENKRFAVEKGLVSGNHRRIPGSGVNTQHFSLQEYPPGGDGKVGEKVVFCYIGRILKEKGIDDYLETAGYIKDKYPCTTFDIIGFIEPTEKEYYEKFETLQKAGIINYHGNQKDVRPFITQSHAIIQPSVYGEGISNVLLEAASSGRVLFTTDNPGCRDTVENKVTGFVFPKHGVDTLCAQIEEFLRISNNKRKEMGELGREKMVKEFSRKYVVDAYLTEIEKILKSKG